MNKQLIQKRFAKNLNTYDDNAKIQKRMAEHLISLENNHNFANILEIGCGTGYLTKLAIEKFNYNKYIANDLVADCENFIRDIAHDIQFAQGDIENIIKNSNQKYDLIISNATFQWIKDFEDFIKTLVEKLNPNGVLLFSTFGRENFREIYFVLGKTLPYKSSQEYKEILKAYTFSIEEESHALMFKSPVDVLRHIKSTGVNAIDEISWTKSDMIKFERGYKNFCSGRATLTYNPIYIKIQK